jgi:hypothetical protein
VKRIEIDLGGLWVDSPPEYLSGVTATATLLEDKAPVACALLWDLLPIETRAIHAFWAGRAWRTEANLPLRDRVTVVENPAGNTDLAPGDICLFIHDRLPLEKLFMAYGESRWPHANVSRVARVDENLEALVAASRRVLYEGAKTLVIRRAADAGASPGQAMSVRR